MNHEIKKVRPATRPWRSRLALATIGVLAIGGAAAVAASAGTGAEPVEVEQRGYAQAADIAAQLPDYALGSTVVESSRSKWTTSFNQQTAVADGVVTPLEYTKSVRATAACIAAQGVETTDLALSPNGRFWEFSYAGAEASTEAAAATNATNANNAFSQCYSNYQIDVDEIWVAQTDLAPAVWDSVIDDWSACMAGEGVDTSGATPPPSDDTVVAAALVVCGEFTDALEVPSP